MRRIKPNQCQRLKDWMPPLLPKSPIWPRIPSINWSLNRKRRAFTSSVSQVKDMWHLCTKIESRVSSKHLDWTLRNILAITQVKLKRRLRLNKFKQTWRSFKRKVREVRTCFSLHGTNPGHSNLAKFIQMYSTKMALCSNSGPSISITKVQVRRQKSASETHIYSMTWLR